MANSLIHALSSVRRYGGTPEDYQPIHDWFDATKSAYAGWEHRVLRHHAFGIFECEERFGHGITNSDGKVVPVRVIAEQHVIEDCGFIPTVQDWLKNFINPEEWMMRGAKPVSKILENLEATERMFAETDQHRTMPVPDPEIARQQLAGMEQLLAARTAQHERGEVTEDVVESARQARDRWQEIVHELPQSDQAKTY